MSKFKMGFEIVGAEYIFCFFVMVVIAGEIG
ncbi:MAG: hypothetical protein MHPDNHAH_01827 [Anaerolineales bacterium]|nr:hypothetical protein [Anaerolineales bacterium]